MIKGSLDIARALSDPDYRRRATAFLESCDTYRRQNHQLEILTIKKDLPNGVGKFFHMIA